MCRLLGLNPAPNNGSLSILMETLVENTNEINYNSLSGLLVAIVLTVFCFNALRRVL